jgi:hypothetical protein
MVPTGLIEDQHGVRAGRDLGCDFSEVQVHCLAVAMRQDQGCPFAVLWADGAEDGALIRWRRGPRAAFRPTPRDLVLLADARLVGKADLYALGRDALFARNFI